MGAGARQAVPGGLGSSGCHLDSLVPGSIPGQPGADATLVTKRCGGVAQGGDEAAGEAGAAVRGGDQPPYSGIGSRTGLMSR